MGSGRESQQKSDARIWGMRSPTFVLGYHGCDRDVAERVLGGSASLLESANEYDWLGRGIYFWENSATRALEWARAARANPKITRHAVKEPAAIGAIIDLGNCLDLLE